MSVPEPQAAIDQDGPALPAEVAADARTTGSAGMEPQDRMEALRLDLASVIHEAGCQCRGHKLGWTIRDRDAQQLAAGILAAGYRRVSVDDDTVDAVAHVLWQMFWREVPGYGITKDFWRGPARAAVQALRDGNPQPGSWEPGDPVYPNESARRWCTHCLTGWTGGPEDCPECGRASVEACSSCGARDGCPGCINPPEESP